MIKQVKIVFAFCFSILLYAQSFAQDINLLKEANKQYEKGDYTKAKELYFSLIAKGFNNEALLYNLACASYKTGDAANSILYFEKTLKQNPSNEDAKNNLELAKSLTVDKIEEPYVGFIESFMIKISRMLSVDAWAYLIILCSFLIAISAYLFLYTPNVSLRRFSFSLLLSMCALIIFSFVFANFSYKQLYANSYAIVFNDVIKVNSEPNETAKELFSLHAGTKVNLIETHENWAQIALPNGSRGWTQLSALEKI